VTNIRRKRRGAKLGKDCKNSIASGNKVEVAGKREGKTESTTPRANRGCTTVHTLLLGIGQTLPRGLSDVGKVGRRTNSKETHW
jgi:hypothetical protein